MASLVFAFGLGLLSFLSWTWSCPGPVLVLTCLVLVWVLVLVLALCLGLVSWWKGGQLIYGKSPWTRRPQKARSPLTMIYQVFFQGGGWYVESTWTSQLVTWTVQLVRPPNPPEKKLDIPPPPTHKVLLLQHTVFSKMSWWKDGQLVFSKMSWWKDGQLRRAMVRAPEW